MFFYLNSMIMKKIVVLKVEGVMVKDVVKDYVKGVVNKKFNEKVVEMERREGIDLYEKMMKKWEKVGKELEEEGNEGLKMMVDMEISRIEEIVRVKRSELVEEECRVKSELEKEVMESEEVKKKKGFSEDFENKKLNKGMNKVVKMLDGMKGDNYRLVVWSKYPESRVRMLLYKNGVSGFEVVRDVNEIKGREEGDKIVVFSNDREDKVMKGVKVVGFESMVESGEVFLNRLGLYKKVA